jgi:hypothetical protein
MQDSKINIDIGFRDGYSCQQEGTEMAKFEMSLKIEIEAASEGEALDEVRDRYYIVVPGEVGSVDYELDARELTEEETV